MSRLDGQVDGVESVTLDHSSPSDVAGMVQPHGFVMLLSAQSGLIQRVSANAQDFLGCEPDSLIGVSAEQLLNEAAFIALQEAMQDFAKYLLPQEPRYIPLALSTGQPLEGWLHRSVEFWVLELEVAMPQSQTATIAARDLQRIRGEMVCLQRATTLEQLLNEAAIAAQRLSNLDRVLIYKFAPDHSGTVVAQVNRDGSKPTYMGLRFPATDIPAASRKQYSRGACRYVPDLNAPQLPMVPPLVMPPSLASSLTSSVTKESSDDEQDSDAVAVLDNAMLRAVDPCCVSYHRNIQVAAFLVVPLLQENQLWGLMVCHHRSPVTIPVAVRLDIQLLGQLLATELAHKESQQAFNHRQRLKVHQSEFLAAIAQADDFVQVLIQPELRLLGLTNAQGAAVFFEDEITLVGATPGREAVAALYDWAAPQAEREENSIYQTASLSQHCPPAEAYKDVASGLLFLMLSPARRYAIAWFRPEVPQTVNWAGNPADSYSPNDEGQLELCPRASFERWQETVSHRALHWQTWELESALDLRHSIVGVILRKADEMARVNQELERSNQELASFAYAASHDLKEPLRGISNYSKLLLKENKERLDEKAVKRLETLTKLTRRMASLIDALLRFSRIGQAELQQQTIDLNLVVARVLEMKELSRPDSAIETWTPRPLPRVTADPVLLSEVYSNLLSNALKYNESDNPWVELGYYSAAEIRADSRLPQDWGAPLLYVKDNGIGIPAHHYSSVFELFKRLHSQKKYGGGTGAGLTITQKIIERHGGRIGLHSGEDGTTFYWSLG